jgi:hypothetical protein
MSVATAPPLSAAPRMSVWTTFWALGGGGLVGVIAASAGAAAVRAAFRLDGLSDGAVWNPFPALDIWTRGADLVTLGAALVVCGLCVQRISRTAEMELRIWAGTAAVAVVALVSALTHSWWSLAALVPLAVVLRYAARPTAPRWSWRRRAGTVGVAVAVYAVTLVPAAVSLQVHPLFASPSASCGPVYTGPDNHVAALCLIVENVALTRTATVLGVDRRSLPRGLPWILTARSRTIGAGDQRQVDVRVQPARCRPGAAVILRSVPLRVRIGATIGTAAIALAAPLTARCPG